MEIKVCDVVFREDLYPRIETSAVTVQKYAEDLEVLPPIKVNQHNELIDGWHRWTAHGLEVSFGFMFAEDSPESLRQTPAGAIQDGAFTPFGSVARHYATIHHARVKQRTNPHVYFIRAEHGGPVKIGISNKIAYRLAALQTANPYRLRVIGVIPHGGEACERLLHRDFAQCRLHGEWFEWNSEFERLFA